jgi:uncharacterized protein YndB with AHSA1/START domain
MTKETTSFVYVTYIASTAERVYEAITRPEVARRYWGHENVSDWAPGSGWQHVRADESRNIQVIGKVVEAVAPGRLVITWADPARAEEAKAYSRVTFEIAEYDEMVRLTVTHDELEPEGGMAKGIRKGWPIVLSSLKSYLETGRSLDVFAVPKSP